MVGVDVGCYLEDEAGKLRLFGLYGALLSLCWSWRRSYLDKAVEQFLHTEVVQCRTEEYGSHLSRAVCLNVKLGIYAVNQLHVVAQLLGILLADVLFKFCRVDVNLHLFSHALLVGLEEVEFVLVDIVHTLELDTDVDRP